MYTKPEVSFTFWSPITECTGYKCKLSASVVLLVLWMAAKGWSLSYTLKLHLDTSCNIFYSLLIFWLLVVYLSLCLFIYLLLCLFLFIIMFIYLIIIMFIYLLLLLYFFGYEWHNKCLISHSKDTGIEFDTTIPDSPLYPLGRWTWIPDSKPNNQAVSSKYDPV